jgi:hypothetical protein
MFVLIVLIFIVQEGTVIVEYSLIDLYEHIAIAI